MLHKLVLFDIDGTILLSKHTIHRHRFNYAIKKVYGISQEVDWDSMHGQTDTSIFLLTLTQAGIPKDQILEKLPIAFEHTYEYFVQNIPDNFHETILPGVKNLIKKLQNVVHLGILSGNYEKTGWHKLELVGLRHYFEFGVFGHEGEDRLAIARLVQKKAKKHFGEDFSSDHIYIIGDTPKDIECAREINAHAIAVATGRYTEEELQEYNPNLLVSSLEDKKVYQYILKSHEKLN
ncbi:MAG: HAD hydrolase-like protein [Patescibacteria group bacterium]|nr:HAD hydrolase-like protein [Patescibacteria group bacterium]